MYRSNRIRRPFPARYPGKCCCGARFDKGAGIFWDAAARIATGCPACRAPRAVKGTWTTVGGVDVRIDTHPQTGEAAIVVLALMCEGMDVETYQIRDGEWCLRGGMVFTRVHSHEQIVAIIAAVRKAAA